MVISEIEFKDLQDYFNSAQLPRTFKLNAATTINDLPAFIRQVLENLKKRDIAEAAIRPRYYDLLEIKRILENKNA